MNIFDLLLIALPIALFIAGTPLILAVSAD